MKTATTTNNQNVTLQLTIEQVKEKMFQQIDAYVLYPEFIDNKFYLYTTFGKQQEKERSFDTLESFNKQYETCIKWGLKQAGLRLKKETKEVKQNPKNVELSKFLQNYKLNPETFGSIIKSNNTKLTIIDYNPRNKNPFIAMDENNKVIKLPIKEVQKLLPA